MIIFVTRFVGPLVVELLLAALPLARQAKHPVLGDDLLLDIAALRVRVLLAMRVIQLLIHMLGFTLPARVGLVVVFISHGPSW